MKVQQLISPVLILCIAVVLRLIPHPPNMAPIAAMALFGGAYLNKRYALVVPLLAMVVSDIFLGFHSVILFVYGSFLLTGIMGIWLKSHRSLPNTIGVTLVSSILFYLITNFGVWLVGGMYSKTIDGLFQSYFYALPFFRNTIIGDLFYTALFFGSYEFVTLLVYSRAAAHTK